MLSICVSTVNTGPDAHTVGPKAKKQVRSDNDASEVDILEHYGTF